MLRRLPGKESESVEYIELNERLDKKPPQPIPEPQAAAAMEVDQPRTTVDDDDGPEADAPPSFEVSSGTSARRDIELTTLFTQYPFGTEGH